MRKVLLIAVAAVMALALFAGCAQPQQEPAESSAPVSSAPESSAPESSAPESSAPAEAESDVVIGISIGDLRLERWQRDVDLMKKSAVALGVKEENILVANANADENVQNSQCSDLITKGINVLIIMPQNGETCEPVVKEAHDAGIKVIAYERLLMNCDLDYLVSFDNFDIGVKQAQSLVDVKPSGKYFQLCGSPTDINATIYQEAQMTVLQPLIDKGDIELVGEQWVKNWDTDEAFKIVENALTANNNEIDAIVASNDSTAQGAVQAVVQQNLAGKVLISGQDADLLSCQYVAEGKQTTTVYKPLQKLAAAAIDLALKLANGEDVSTTATKNNGKIDVKAIQLEVVTVKKDNLVDTVIADGFHTYEDVFKNVPEGERPPKQ